MIHHVPSPQLKTVRSPFIRPSGDNIGASRAPPADGSLDAITRFNHASAPAPETSNREKPEISRSPTLSRTVLHSSATMGKAFERFSVGVSTKSLDGAK